MLFLLYSVNVMNYTGWFSTVKPIFQTWNNPGWSQCLSLWEHFWVWFPNLEQGTHCIRFWTVIFFVTSVSPGQTFFLRVTALEVSCRAFSRPLRCERFCVVKVLSL